VRTLRHILLTMGAYIFIVLPVIYTIGVFTTGIYIPTRWQVFVDPVGQGAFVIVSIAILIDLYKYMKKELL
jgi:hypothetical protein